MNDKTHIEHNESAFGCITTERSFGEHVEPDSQAVIQASDRRPNHALRTHGSEPICFSPYLYHARNLVERFFNKIKHCRRVATRYDKLAANYLAFVQLASIRLWLR
jgi:transposase